MSFSIIIQSTYSTTHIGLYKEGRCIDNIHNIEQASTSLVPALDALLLKNSIELKNISYIGAHQGPGPFTSLRVLLASINGIACAGNIPLIGIDGLDALLEEHTNTAFPITVALLNAYNKDAYFGIEDHGLIVRKGYKNITQLLEELCEQFPAQQIRFIGQGVDIFREAIVTQLQGQAYVPSPLPEAPSLDIIAYKANLRWQQGATSHQLLPLYLKALQYKKSIVS